MAGELCMGKMAAIGKMAACVTASDLGSSSWSNLGTLIGLTRSERKLPFLVKFIYCRTWQRISFSEWHTRRESVISLHTTLGIFLIRESAVSASCNGLLP